MELTDIKSYFFGLPLVEKLYLNILPYYFI